MIRAVVLSSGASFRVQKSGVAVVPAPKDTPVPKTEYLGTYCQLEQLFPGYIS